MLNFEQQRTQVAYETRIVMGAIPFKDMIDGKEVDVCNVFIAAPFDPSRGAIGFGAIKVGFGKSVNIHRFNGISLPTTLEIAFQEVASGSGRTKRVILDVRVPQSKQKE